jgi:hypothetical protein
MYLKEEKGRLAPLPLNLNDVIANIFHVFNGHMSTR